MAKPAYVVLGSTGTVVRCHTTDIGLSGSGPSTGAGDVETLIGQGYQAKREVALDGGSVLIVLEKP